MWIDVEREVSLDQAIDTRPHSDPQHRTGSAGIPLLATAGRKADLEFAARQHQSQRPATGFHI
jgi:hypothetical protein